MPKISAIQMTKILQQYAAARGINLNVRNWNEITAAFYNYNIYASKLN